MHTRTLTILFVFFAISIAALGQERTDSINNGAKHFFNYCGLCHRLSATPVKPGLVWRYAKSVSDEELRSRIRLRASSLSKKEKEELFNYIRFFESEFNKTSGKQGKKYEN